MKKKKLRLLLCFGLTLAMGLSPLGLSQTYAKTILNTDILSKADGDRLTVDKNLMQEILKNYYSEEEMNKILNDLPSTVSPGTVQDQSYSIFIEALTSLLKEKGGYEETDIQYFLRTIVNDEYSWSLGELGDFGRRIIEKSPQQQESSAASSSVTDTDSDIVTLTKKQKTAIKGILSDYYSGKELNGIIGNIPDNINDGSYWGESLLDAFLSGSIITDEVETGLSESDILNILGNYEQSNLAKYNDAMEKAMKTKLKGYGYNDEFLRYVTNHVTDVIYNAYIPIGGLTDRTPSRTVRSSVSLSDFLTHKISKKEMDPIYKEYLREETGFKIIQLLSKTKRYDSDTIGLLESAMLHSDRSWTLKEIEDFYDKVKENCGYVEDLSLSSLGDIMYYVGIGDIISSADYASDGNNQLFSPLSVWTDLGFIEYLASETFIENEAEENFFDVFYDSLEEYMEEYSLKECWEDAFVPAKDLKIANDYLNKNGYVTINTYWTDKKYGNISKLAKEYMEKYGNGGFHKIEYAHDSISDDGNVKKINNYLSKKIDTSDARFVNNYHLTHSKGEPGITETAIQMLSGLSYNGILDIEKVSEKEGSFDKALKGTVYNLKGEYYIKDGKFKAAVIPFTDGDNCLIAFETPKNTSIEKFAKTLTKDKMEKLLTEIRNDKNTSIKYFLTDTTIVSSWFLPGELVDFEEGLGAVFAKKNALSREYGATGTHYKDSIEDGVKVKDKGKSISIDLSNPYIYMIYNKSIHAFTIMGIKENLL